MSKLRNTFVKKIVYFPGYSPMMNGKDKIEFVSLFVPCIVCGFYARDDTGNGSFFFCFLWSVPVKSITVHSWAYVQPRHELLYQAWPEFHSRREKLSEFHVTLYKQCQMIVRLTKLCETPFQYMYIFVFFSSLKYFQSIHCTPLVCVHENIIFK